MWAIKSVYSEAYVVRDAALLDVVANMPLAQRVGVPLYEGVDEQFWPKVGFGASMLPTAPLKLKAVGDQVRKSIQNKSRNTPTNQPARRTSGSGASVPLSPNAQKMLNLIGPKGSSLDWATLRRKAADSGIRNPNEYKAIEELEGWGVITVTRRGSDNLNILTVLVN